MRNVFALLQLLAASLLVAGCWTFNTTPYPAVATTAASHSATNITVSVAGFEAVLTEYEAVHGFRTVYVPGYYCGPHYVAPGYFETVPAVTYLPQRRATDMFLRRAQDQFERAGFRIGATVADCVVDVRFSGPYVTSNDGFKRVCWNLLTVFFCDYAKAQWTAALRIRDTRSGKLMFSHDYEQCFETNVFGLLPLFSTSCADETAPVYIQSWCLAALTDRAVADATAFLSH